MNSIIIAEPDLFCTNDLTALATEINAAVARADASLDLFKKQRQATIDEYAIAGQLLLTAKAHVNHGQWLPWLGKHCPDLAEHRGRRAQEIMQIARNLETLKSADSATLTKSGALKLLTAPEPAVLTQAPTIPRWERNTPEQNARDSRRWPDMLASTVAHLDVEGHEPDTMAAMLGVDIAEIMAVLDPQLPPLDWGNEPADPELEEIIVHQARCLLASWKHRALQTAAWGAIQYGKPDLAQELKSLAKSAERQLARLEASSPPTRIIEAFSLGIDLARAAMLTDLPPQNVYMEIAMLGELMELPASVFGDTYEEEYRKLEIPYSASFKEIQDNRVTLREFDRTWVARWQHVLNPPEPQSKNSSTVRSGLSIAEIEAMAADYRNSAAAPQ